MEFNLIEGLRFSIDGIKNERVESMWLPSQTKGCYHSKDFICDDNFSFRRDFRLKTKGCNHSKDCLEYHFISKVTLGSYGLYKTLLFFETHLITWRVRVWRICCDNKKSHTKIFTYDKRLSEIDQRVLKLVNIRF